MLNCSSINYGTLTINDCRQLLNITSVTLRRWIKDGVIETKCVGKKHIIKRESIDSMLA